MEFGRTILISLLMVLYFAIFALPVIAMWRLFRKMGHRGWESIIPFYNTYVIFQELYGDGWRFLFLLIPFYNIYVLCKMEIDLAHAFGRSTGFGWGLILLGLVFLCILAFGKSRYRNAGVASGGAVPQTIRIGVPECRRAAENLRKLHEEYQRGDVTQQEYVFRKQLLLQQI